MVDCCTLIILKIFWKYSTNQSIKDFTCSSATVTSKLNSSSDQELAWATHCLVAVTKASGLNSPPIQTVQVFREAAPCLLTLADTETSWLTRAEKSVIQAATEQLLGIFKITKIHKNRIRIGQNPGFSKVMTQILPQNLGFSVIISEFFIYKGGRRMCHFL